MKQIIIYQVTFWDSTSHTNKHFTTKKQAEAFLAKLKEQEQTEEGQEQELVVMDKVNKISMTPTREGFARFCNAYFK